MIQEKLILFALCGLGVIFAWLYGYKAKGFRWSEYFAFVGLPFIAVLWYAFSIDTRLLFFFFVSVVFGTTAEFLLGFFLDQAFGKKLWDYSRLSIFGYTSILSIPIWGFAGTMFWIISSVVGLH